MRLRNRIRSNNLIPFIHIDGIKYSIAPTKYGFAYCFILFALLVGSINHNNNLGYLLTFFLGGMFLVSSLFTYRNLTGVNVLGHDAQQVFAGQLCRIVVKMEAGLSSKYGINAALDPDHAQYFDIDDGDRTTVTLSYPAGERGILNIRFIDLSTNFPFGLIKLNMRQPVKLKCLVYPRPVPVQLQKEGSNGSESGEFRQEKKGIGDFTGLDQYFPGDSLKRIHWKGLAGGRGIHTKRFEENETSRTIFSLQELPGNDIELKLSQLTYMVLTASAKDMEYGVRLGDFLIAPDRGSAHKNDCLKELALYKQ